SLFFPIFPPTPTPPLFPYTTLFRSRLASVVGGPHLRRHRRRRRCLLRMGRPSLGHWDRGHAGGRGRDLRSGGRVHPSPVPHDLRSEEHTSELQSRFDLVCRLLLEKK